MNYKRFGVMLDCSRNGVLTVENVKRHVDVLSKMGYNCIQLYTEDTYEVDGYPLFGYLRGRYTKAELKEIDAYAKSKQMELIPCIQTLAHLPAVKKNYDMGYLFDIDDILLCGEERTYEFLDKCFQTLAECFTSRMVNIGMDEAHMVGLGRYLDKNGYTRRFDILINHLKRVNQIAEKYGFKPIMWSDMFFRLANNGAYTAKDVHIPKDVVAEIPDSVGLVYWEYQEPEQEMYDSMLASHLEMGKEVWFAGGLWSYHGFVPFNGEGVKRMGEAMKSVRKNKIENVIITLWGNGGTECSYLAFLPSLYAVKQMADGVTDMDEIKSGFKRLFGLDYDAFCLLDLPQINPKKERGYWVDTPATTMFYQDPLLGYYDEDYPKMIGSMPFEEYAQELKSVAPKMGEYAYLFENMAALCSFMDKKAELGIRTRKAYANNDKEAMRLLLGDYDECVVRLSTFYEARRKLWHLEYKGFGWEIQDIRLGGLERRLLSCKRKLSAWVLGEIDKVEELEEEILPVGRDAIVDEYGNVISRCKLAYGA